MSNKVLFIINKFSGTGFQDSLEGRIIDDCSKLNIEVDIQYTQHKGHATELAHQAASEGIGRVFAMGGDGTVNETAQGLVNTDTAMGILPKGSGNGLARHLHIPLSIPRALSLLDKHQVMAMDTLRVNDHLSVNVSGIGFDGQVAGQFGKNGKRGLVSYGQLVIREFKTFKEFPISITIDGKEIQRESFIVAFANSSQFGNNAKISPMASVCDQLIDICFVKKVPMTHIVGFTQKMFTGQLDKSSFVEVVQGRSITIDFDKPMPYHIDGEAMEPATHFDIGINPLSLKMIVPDKKELKI